MVAAAAVILAPLLLLLLACEDRRNRGIRRTWRDIAELAAIGAATIAFGLAVYAALSGLGI